MKELGYRFFALIYYICRIFPRKKNRCFLVMTHDSSREGNVGTIQTELEKSGRTYEFCRLVRSETEFGGADKVRKLIRFFLVKPYQLATASYVFQDNIFLPMAFLRFPPEVAVVQLWHGTGTIKQFGYDANHGRLRDLEVRANQTITHLVVNSEYTRKLYQHIFSVTEDKVYTYGLPRTDLFFHTEAKEEKVSAFYLEYPQLKGKKLILYAPTFRDDELVKPKLRITIDTFLSQLPEEYCLGLRLHPHVARNLRYEGAYANRVYDFSRYENLNTLLFASAILVTDYSSIVFEYCVLDRPMIFYAYDLNRFEKSGRGFYEPYERYVPGPVVRTQEEMAAVINSGEFQDAKRAAFIQEAYAYQDGQSAKRILSNVMRP